MRAVVYITKNKIWAGDHSFGWDGEDLGEVFGKIKRELKINEIGVVLGNDVSFVTAIKAGDISLTRDNILRLVKPLVPFEIDDGCFDWKQVVLGFDEIWIQIVALEKKLLNSLMSAVNKHGVRVDIVTAIGALLGEKTQGREAPVIIRWKDKENLLVLAVNGLADIVVSDINREELVVYASHRWGLAVNPEEISFDESEFNLPESVFSEKNKGEDKAVLNIPIHSSIGSQRKLETDKVGVAPKRSCFPVCLLIISAVVIGVIAFIINKL